jgi:hypothetical protein
MTKEETWHRRHVMLASQLPERIEDARIILRLTAELLEDFLSETGPTEKPSPVVILGGKAPGT